MNDLSEQVESRVSLFADDTAMYLAISSTAEGQILQTDLACLEQWEKMWDMQFNPSKCLVLHIIRKVRPLNIKYILHNVELESASAAKYLGATIADDLTLSPHIDNTTKKANQTPGFLKRNIQAHNKDLKSIAYKTLVMPHLEYASTVWHPHYDKARKNITRKGMSNTFIGNYAWGRCRVKIQVSWPEKPILAENALENTKKSVWNPI